MTEKTIAQQINLEAAKKLVPLSVFIELTHRCNLTCYYCYQASYKHQKELSLHQWRGVLKQLAEMGTLYVTFSGGEPFLREDFLEILANARKHNFAVSIISNGLLLTKEWAAGLADLGIMDVGISLHAANALLHDKLSGAMGSFNDALQAIRLLVTREVKVLIKHSVSNANFGEYTQVEKIADAEGCGFECDTGILPAEYETVSPFALSQKQQRTFLADMGVKPITTCDTSRDESTLHCDAGRSLCGITPGGDVYPCIILPIDLGNFVDTPFKEIWHGKKADQFRNDEKTLSQECLSCKISHHCSRCHGFAFVEEGKWEGKSRSLCERAKAMDTIKS